MPPLSAHAADILDQMDPDLGYQPSDLRAFAPELSVEAIREVMQELWIARKVERVGYAGWRRVRTVTEAPSAPRGPVQLVKPEDLFDHDAFSDIFK